MVMWLWKSFRSVISANSRPTLILPTAMGPKIRRNFLEDCLGTKVVVNV